MNLDIVIYAIIAVVILARLWMVLGNRSDSDRERPNPFSLIPGSNKKDDDENFAPGNGTVRGDVPALLKPFQSAPASLAGGLEQIKALDPAFDEKQFLQSARTIFANVVAEFTKGDMSDSVASLAPPVLEKFRAAIDARRTAGQVMENKIVRIRDAETAKVQIDGTKVFIDVQFVSDQENVLRDAAGRVIGGEPGKVEQVTDLWVFSRDTASNNPNWTLVETKS